MPATARATHSRRAVVWPPQAKPSEMPDLFDSAEARQCSATCKDGKPCITILCRYNPGPECYIHTPEDPT